MKALETANPLVSNIRRPYPGIASGEAENYMLNVKGKYDYLIDLPDLKDVPVDPKTVRRWRTRSNVKQ